MTPTQADREAYIAFNNLPGGYLAAVRAGKWDETTGMQILARHASAAREEALEQAAAYLKSQPDTHISYQTIWRLAQQVRALKLPASDEDAPA